ncbi:MAG: lytic transglycosylase domain-containing protein [Hahellaceae bacterium]|nr:lytic transglycosylase domain-containing protein [Hahellaceae bacterium]
MQFRFEQRQILGCFSRLTLLWLVQAIPVEAGDGYRKIVHPDGTVEFTNSGSPVSPPPKTNRAGRSDYIVYKYQQDDGVVSFSDSRPDRGVELEIIKLTCFACSPRSKVDWHTTPLNLSAYQPQIEAMAKTYALSPAYIRAIIHAESGFNPKALSTQGAQGLMQLMPGTAKDLGVGNAFDTDENIRGGSQYLAQLLKEFNGDERLATAAYNAGPNAVKRFGDIPPYDETRTYVERVGILHARYQQAL